VVTVVLDDLAYPLRAGRPVGRVLLGGLLVPLGFLGVPAFAIYGYALRGMAAGARDRPDHPDLGEWPTLLLEGVRGTAVTLAYLLPVAALWVGLYAGPLAGGGVGPAGPTPVGFVVAATAAVAYVLPAALARAVVSGRTRAAFALGRILPALTHRQYLLGWAKPAALAAVGLSVTALAVATAPATLIVIPFASFYAAVCLCYMFGRAYGAAADVGGPGTDGLPTSERSAGCRVERSRSNDRRGE
jgi:hypothetical protein